MLLSQSIFQILQCLFFNKNRRFIFILLSMMFISCHATDENTQIIEPTPMMPTSMMPTPMSVVEHCQGYDTWIEIPTRIHMLSSTIPSLNATLNENQFREILAEAQFYLDQACIKVNIESFITQEIGAEKEQAFRENLATRPANDAFRQMMVEVMPRENILQPGWNIMVFKAFENYTSGVYLTDIPSVLWAEELPRSAGSRLNPPLILAHEIGHSLGLLHYEGSNLEFNLMCQEVMQNQETASKLTEEQILSARQQAESGSSFLP